MGSLSLLQLIFPTQELNLGLQHCRQVLYQLSYQETQTQSLGQEDPLEKELATHSSILAWKNSKDRGGWQATVHRIAKSRT